MPACPPKSMPSIIWVTKGLANGALYALPTSRAKIMQVFMISVSSVIGCSGGELQDLGPGLPTPPGHNLRLLLRADICLAFMQSHTDRTDMTTRRKIILVGLLICAAIIGSMIDCVKPEGDHITYLVLAPHPTLRFSYSGGEEGSWKHTHPNMKEPWWVAGRYLALMEVGY